MIPTKEWLAVPQNFWYERPSQWVPDQYQGWVFVGFIIIAMIALAYGFYRIATDPTLGRNT